MQLNCEIMKKLQELFIRAEKRKEVVAEQKVVLCSHLRI